MGCSATESDGGTGHNRGCDGEGGNRERGGIEGDADGGTETDGGTGSVENSDRDR